MEPGDAINIIIILVLLLLSAFFSSAETALTTVSKLKMRALAEDKNKAAARVLKLFEEQSKNVELYIDLQQCCKSFRLFHLYYLCLYGMQTDGIGGKYKSRRQYCHGNPDDSHTNLWRNNSKDGRNNKCRKAGTFIQPHNPAIDKVTNANYFYHRQNHGFHIISHAG